MRIEWPFVGPENAKEFRVKGGGGGGGGVLVAGVTTDPANYRGETALKLAMKNGDAAVVEILRSSGVEE